MTTKAMLGDTYKRTLKLWSDDEAIPMDLHTACGCGDYEHTKKLLADGVDPDRPNRGGWTPLCYAAFFGFADIAELLLDHGKANVDGRSLNSVTPLMWASACSNNESIVQSMLRHGADLNAVDDAGRCPLTWAIITEQKAAARILLEAGADTEARRGNKGRTALLLAVAERSEAMVDLLLAYNAKPDAVDENGLNAFALAQEPPYSSAIVNLLKRGKVDPRRVSSKEDLRSPANVGGGLGVGDRSDCPRPSPEPRKDILPTTTKDTSTSPSRRRASGTIELATSDVSTVEEFLSRLKLTKYLPLFEGIDFKTLVAMDEAKLKSLGLTLFGPRRKVFFATQQWKESNAKT
eukprot:m.37801 g.37801  ORF g.37801 m.37801 type:complete len:349 (-) comp7739_c0_seq2:1713-2759(-)